MKYFLQTPDHIEEVPRDHFVLLTTRFPEIEIDIFLDGIVLDLATSDLAEGDICVAPSGTVQVQSAFGTLSYIVYDSYDCYRHVRRYQLTPVEALSPVTINRYLEPINDPA